MAKPRIPADRRGLYRLMARAYVRGVRDSRPCVKCGCTDWRVLDFHHRDHAQKYDAVTRGTSQGWSVERLREEIAKCDVLCANCHRIAHWESRHAQAERTERE